MSGSPMDPERLAPEGWEVEDWIATNVSEGLDELLIEHDGELGEAWDSIGMVPRRVLGSQVASIVREQLGPLLADRDRREVEAQRYRSRCPVTAEDVERAGMTWAHVTAWLDSHGWTRRSGRGMAHDAGGNFVHWGSTPSKWDSDVVCVYENEYPEGIARTLGSIARHVKRVGLDILDEMAKGGTMTDAQDIEPDEMTTWREWAKGSMITAEEYDENKRIEARDSLWARLVAVEATRLHNGAASLDFAPFLACIKLTGLFGPEFNGRLLALVREGHSDPTLFAAFLSVANPRNGTANPRWYVWTDTENPGGLTEAEALVAALEAAP